MKVVKMIINKLNYKINSYIFLEIFFLLINNFYKKNSQ